MLPSGQIWINKMRKSELFFNVARLPVDFTMLVLAGLVAYELRTEILSYFRPVLFEFNLPLLKYLYILIFVSLFFLVAYAISGLYNLKLKRSLSDELGKIVIGSSAGIMGVIIYIFLRQELFNSRFLVLGGWLLAIIFVFLGRILIRYIQLILSPKFKLTSHRLIIIGDGEVAERLKEFLVKDNVEVVDIIKDSDQGILGKLSSFDNVDELILTSSILGEEVMSDLISLCHERHIVFKFIPGMHSVSFTNIEFDIIGGTPLIEVKRTSLEGWGRVIKRLIDITISLLGIIILSPIFLIVSFAIKWETEGPVFARLLRVSGNKSFYLYKFRSMINNAEELKSFLSGFNERKDGPLFKMKNDPRVTRVGRILRKFRVDEIPQLFNIISGSISLVGPRPHEPKEIANYEKHHKKVLSIKGGATGLAQVSGSSDLPFDREVALDSFYIDNWSLWLDLKILSKTFFKILKDKSAV